MSEFDAEISGHVDGVLVVKFAGVMDVFTLADFGREFRGLCDNPNEDMVAVDLGKVDYIASSGWSVLLASRSALVRHGGEMSIYGLHDGNRRVYEAMHIGKMLPVAENFEAAQMQLKMHAMNKAPLKPGAPRPNSRVAEEQ